MQKTCRNCEKYRQCSVFSRARNTPCRDYKKRISENETKTRKAYEVSVSNIEAVEVE